MISNITNALPAMLKKMRDNEDTSKGPEFDLVETLNFYDSILPRDKTSFGLKHVFLDCIFYLKPEHHGMIKTFQMTIDTLPFLKEFDYIVDEEENMILIRSNCEELTIFSLILLGAVKNLPKSDVVNKSIFISLAFHYLQYCISSGYKVCPTEDISILEKYNDGFDEEVFESIGFSPTPETGVGTIHFIGIELNKDILKIFERYKDVKFTYNEENASFIVSMRGRDWDDFWKDAPQYLKDEFIGDEERKINVM